MSCRCERPGWLEGHDPGCPYENGATPWFEDRIAELQAENAKLKVNLEQSREQEKQTAMTLDGFVGDLEKAHNAQVPTEILCPECGKLHVDQDEWATTRLHRKHLCHGCGHVWQPYVVTTTGVDFHVGCQERIARAEADVTWIRSAWQTEIEENKKLGKELHEALTENAQLHTRRDELLAMVAQLSQTVPLDSEVAEALNQRGALLAEVGTLKARIAELESMLPAQPGKG